MMFFRLLNLLAVFCVFMGCANVGYSNTVQGQSRKLIDVTFYGIFPAKSPKETENVKYERWQKIRFAFQDAIKNDYDLFFPKGTYDVGPRNFPFQEADLKAKQLLDCRGITIKGAGRGTILKTSSSVGADVLQLNMVKNITIKDFDITADLYSFEKAGSNGISITHGFDNITLDNIYIYNLPRIDKGNYIDGGKGLTLQFDETSDALKGTLSATNIKVMNSAYGFRFDATTLSKLLDQKIRIKLQMESDRSFQGFSMSFGSPIENVMGEKFIDMDVDAVLKNAQQYVAFSRVVGGNYRFTVDKTISNSQINKDESGKVWYKADPFIFAFLSNYSKNTDTSIKGNVGIVDIKLWMGAVGMVVEPFNLKNRTENNTFTFDIKGTSTDKDFKIIEYQGNSISNSIFNISPNTLKNNQIPKEARVNNNRFTIK